MSLSTKDRESASILLGVAAALEFLIAGIDKPAKQIVIDNGSIAVDGQRLKIAPAGLVIIKNSFKSSLSGLRDETVNDAQKLLAGIVPDASVPT